jgi:hypothetical protein
MRKLIPRSSGLEPDNYEIIRRYAENLDAVKRLTKAVMEDPNEYCLGEDAEDFLLIASQAINGIELLIGLLQNPTPDILTKMEEEALTGNSGEAKSNFWTRLKYKVFDAFYSKAGLLRFCEATIEYFDYGKIIVESIEKTILDSTIGKTVSEFFGFAKQVLSSVKNRAAEDVLDRP